MNKTLKSTMTTLLVTALLVTIVPSLISTPEAIESAQQSINTWTFVNTRGVKNYPNLTEYVWQKNATTLPNGPYDKIGLHRLVKNGIKTKGTVFMLPGTYGSGEGLMSNPPDTSDTVNENISQPIYFANRGFDVYSIDWRAHFLPMNMSPSQASAIVTNWGYDQYISDLKEAVEKTKEVSGNAKIFLWGHAFGEWVAMYYASEYWSQDLKGLILLDGSENTIKYPKPTNAFNLTEVLSKGGNYTVPVGGGNMTLQFGLVWENPRSSPTDFPPSGMLFAFQNALQNPGAPAEWPPGTPLQPKINPATNKTWANITEYIAYWFYSNKFSNINAGYGNNTIDTQWQARGDRYFPTRLALESLAIRNWTNCPYVSYDFDDHYKDINVPVLGFKSGLYGIPGNGPFINGLATTDFTQSILPQYMHFDLFIGTNSVRDASEPTLQWMLGQIDGLKATAFCNVSVLPGWTWNFFAHSTGGTGTLTYQWYEGSTLLQGQTSMVLPVTKTSPGTYTLYCKVTDSEGGTANSNTVTLTVMS